MHELFKLEASKSMSVLIWHLQIIYFAANESTAIEICPVFELTKRLHGGDVQYKSLSCTCINVAHPFSSLLAIQKLFPVLNT